MTTPDLVFQTKLQKKLSPETLGHGQSVTTFKILSAHLFDFGIIYGLSVFCSHFFNQTFSGLMVTDGLEKAWSKTTHHAEYFACLATIMAGYFFFSYFFNAGQTFGMKVNKIRMIVPMHSWTASAKGMLASLGLFFTGGISLSRIEDSFVPHDHLYLELIQGRDLQPINLVDSIQRAESWVEETGIAA